jgi:predicted nucleic acid-binding protein
MANEIFVDTSGFYAMLVRDDDRHAAAKHIIEAARASRRGFLTTDHVLGETVTLLIARRLPHLIGPAFDIIEKSPACHVEWTDPERFREVRRFILKHSDKSWSFTDCLSFHVMQQFQVREALTKDKHFEQIGFVRLLA